MTIPPVQQYTNNQIGTQIRSRLCIWILATIVLGGFKEFNSTLTKTEIQIRSSSLYYRRLPVQAWKPTVKHDVQSIPISVPVNYGVSKTLEGVMWTVKKLKKKLSNTRLRSGRNARLTQAIVQFKTRGSVQAGVQFKTQGLIKPAFQFKREAQSKPAFII